MRYLLILLLLPSIAMADHTVQMSYGSFFDLDTVVEHGNAVDVTHMVDVHKNWDVGVVSQLEWGSNRGVDLRMITIHAAIRYAPTFKNVQPYAQLSVGYTAVHWDIQLLMGDMEFSEHSITKQARVGVMLSNPANCWGESMGIFFEADRMLFATDAVDSFRAGVSIRY